MKNELVDQIARAVLYEGYILYPYRQSIKNRQRWSFGGLYPKAFADAQTGSDAAMMQTQILLRGGPSTTLDIRAAFLHLQARTIGQLPAPIAAWPAEREPKYHPVDFLKVGEKTYQTWQEATEREAAAPRVTVADLLDQPRRIDFSFDADRHIEPLRDPAGRYVGVIDREQQAISGTLELAAARVEENLFRITARTVNTTPFDSAPEDRQAALLRALVSTHMVLGVTGGALISATDPPEALLDANQACQNIGCWPVLVGIAPAADTMLASPIILYDYPQIAPESPGDLFDGTEIDEILSLRIMTLTDAEKQQVAATDDRAGAMLARTEALARDQMMSLHGTMRNLSPAGAPDIDFPTFYAPAGEAKLNPAKPAWDDLENHPKLQSVRVGDGELKAGDRVRLHPLGRADIFDIALEGMTATIQRIEQDFENRVQLVVTVDDDPGKDFGAAGKPGHQFFFGVEEVELLEPAEAGGEK